MDVEIDFYYELYRDYPYAEQVSEIKEYISQHSPNAKSLLDIACGTGDHLKLLEQDFECVGIDISQTQIDRCRSKLKSEVFLQDMTNFSFDRKFDVIMVLFGGIAFCKTHEKYAETIKNIRNHLNEGGIVLIEPFLFSEQFECGSIRDTTISRSIEGEEIEIESTITREGDLCVLNKNYTVKGVKHSGRIELLLMTVDQYKKPFAENGFRSKIIPFVHGHYRHLYVLTLD